MSNLCCKCGLPLGDTTLYIDGRAYHRGCIPASLPLPEDVARMVEQLHVIVREPNESTSDLIDRWRKDRQAAAALIQSLSSQLVEMKANMVPIHADGSHVFIDGPGDVELDHGGKLRAERDRLAAELERMREASTLLLSEIDASSDINAIVGASNPLRTALAGKAGEA